MHCAAGRDVPRLGANQPTKRSPMALNRLDLLRQRAGYCQTARTVCSARHRPTEPEPSADVSEVTVHWNVRGRLSLATSTMARIALRRCSGSVGQASLTAARSGSSVADPVLGVALCVARVEAVAGNSRGSLALGESSEASVELRSGVRVPSVPLAFYTLREEKRIVLRWVCQFFIAPGTLRVTG